MDYDQTLRPRLPREPTVDKEPRKKCVLCCGAYCAAWVGGFTAFFTMPCSFVAHETKAGTWPKVFNRYMFIPLPIMTVCFIHQVLMSQALWSPRKRLIADLNWSVVAISMSLQFAAVAACTAVSRNVIPRFSKSYRLTLWDYNRVRRNQENKFLPSAAGTLTEHFDYINACWHIATYHLGWAMAVTAADATLKSRYAIWYRGMEYSKRCSPRWREWTENEIANKIDINWQPSPVERWGSIFTLDPWRQRV